MSPLLIQMLGFMFATFVLGLALGWLIWSFRSADKHALEALTTERDFWQNYAKQDRGETQAEAAAGQLASVPPRKKRFAFKK